ncbi:hypothetical protein BOTNAR_0097g00140 [Botryotinia narcissicola]|uniref:Uncharacterized protein n=1 Tax=Botryotinia narcissicola TaxID=278944 RepID=A0A4Z1ISL1_9HELO|nr:hypothetical protein BOTNAR_0097g00140 [Botryotinia narcissicola]
MAKYQHTGKSNKQREAKGDLKREEEVEDTYDKHTHDVFTLVILATRVRVRGLWRGYSGRVFVELKHLQAAGQTQKHFHAQKFIPVYA